MISRRPAEEVNRYEEDGCPRREAIYPFPFLAKGPPSFVRRPLDLPSRAPAQSCHARAKAAIAAAPVHSTDSLTSNRALWCG